MVAILLAIVIHKYDDCRAVTTAYNTYFSNTCLLFLVPLNQNTRKHVCMCRWRAEYSSVRRWHYTRICVGSRESKKSDCMVLVVRGAWIQTFLRGELAEHRDGEETTCDVGASY